MNQKKRGLFIAIISLSMMFGLNACQDDNGSKNIECDEGQECVDDTHGDENNSCDPACKDGQECVDGTCSDIQTDEKPCAPACKDGQECVDGTCKNVTEPGDESDDDLCGNIKCKPDEVCIDSQCVDYNKTICDAECPDNQECVNGECKDIEPDTGEDLNPEEDLCADVKCPSGKSCIDGKCYTACGTEFCDDEQVCLDENCVSRSELCGEKLCSSEQKCIDSACVDKTDCDRMNCPDGTQCVLDDKKAGMCLEPACIDGDKPKACEAGRTCKAGTCVVDDCSDGTIDPESGDCIVKVTSIDLGSKSLTLLRDSSVTVKATIKPAKASNQKLKWTIENVTENNTDGVKTLATLETDGSNATVTAISVGARKIKLTATSTDGSNVSSSVTITLKPYSDYRTYHYNKFTYNDNGKQRPYLTCKLYGTETTKVFNRDLYIKYVYPKMIEKDGKRYGTRASVVAAARFLMLQFPYFIPYYDDVHSVSNYPTESHYVWASGEKAANGQDVRIFGLNLTKNAYNSYDSPDDGIVKSDVIPWACEGAHYDYYNDKNEKNLKGVNGLACSGFVSWAFRNGRFYIGDWWTHVFKSDSNICDKERSYLCENMVNGISSTSRANPNNVHDSAFVKLKRLDPDKDFVKILDLDEDKLKDIKAGDILWHDGHIAMIIGMQRTSNGKFNGMWIGEATWSNEIRKTYPNGLGNKLTKYTLSELKNSTKWGQTAKPFYVIKMDKVYNYYSDLYKTTEKGNEYGYTDMWTQEK